MQTKKVLVLFANKTVLITTQNKGSKVKGEYYQVHIRKKPDLDLDPVFSQSSDPDPFFSRSSG